MLRDLYQITLDLPDRLFFSEDNPSKLFESMDAIPPNKSTKSVASSSLISHKITKEGTEYTYSGVIDGSVCVDEYRSVLSLFEQKLDDKLKEKYDKWKSLVNMSKSELIRFKSRQLELAKEHKSLHPGLTKDEASEQGISSGVESAEWIVKMKDVHYTDWTPKMWEWCGKQISFISRMKGSDGDLKDKNGNPTRKLLALKIWGHDPYKNI